MKWFDLPFFKEKYKEVKKKVDEEREKFTVYPPEEEVFNAFEKTPFDKVKVVIIGQDPYYTEGAAHGLAFSHPNGFRKIQPSLRNILKEVNSDLGCNRTEINLQDWAKQGVLLYNTLLTVREGKGGSHKGFGWENLTQQVIDAINKHHKGVVFLLWGEYAKNFEPTIDAKKHHILKTSHPSGFSARYGFIGCKHFSKTNEYLVSKGISPINWSGDSSFTVKKSVTLDDF